MLKRHYSQPFKAKICLEPVLAEKLETMVVRACTNTRMRDFYDLHILHTLYGDSLQMDDLRQALAKTAEKRASSIYLQDGSSVISEIQDSEIMEKLWESYCKKFSYAKGLSWDTVMSSARTLFEMTQT